MRRKNVYKIVDNVDNSKKRRKYKKFTVNKNVRNCSEPCEIARESAKEHFGSGLWSYLFPVFIQKIPGRTEKIRFSRERKSKGIHFLFFRSQKLFTDVYNIAGTHGDQHIAGGEILVQIRFDFCKRREIFTRCSFSDNPFLDIF